MVCGSSSFALQYPDLLNPHRTLFRRLLRRLTEAHTKTAQLSVATLYEDATYDVVHLFEIALLELRTSLACYDTADQGT